MGNLTTSVITVTQLEQGDETENCLFVYFGDEYDYLKLIKNHIHYNDYFNLLKPGNSYIIRYDEGDRTIDGVLDEHTY